MDETHSAQWRIGVSIGDPNGVGPEIVQAMFQRSELQTIATFVVYGTETAFAWYNKGDNRQRVSYQKITSAKEARPGRLNFIPCEAPDFKLQVGQCTTEGAAAAVAALTQVGKDLQEGLLDAVVTGPIDKKHLSDSGFSFPGQTEFFANIAGKKGLMFMVHEDIKVAVATGHIPLSQVSGSLSKELLIGKIETMASSLKQDFLIVRPKIALLGINPHAGDDGKFGNEETEFLKPILENNIHADYILAGPYSADAFFAQGRYKMVDACLAMYHDQGLIPFKTLAGFGGVNYTAGLPFVRTSPDHGPAFDIAGRGQAIPDSFLSAIYQALDILKARQMHKVANQNPLRPLSRDLKEMYEE
jgi:4-hydroxythreonine-4-phosphate dehydrogenase